MRVIFGLLGLLLVTWGWFLLTVFVEPTTAFAGVFLGFTVVLASFMIYFYAYGASSTATPKEQPMSDRTGVSPPASAARPKQPPGIEALGGAGGGIRSQTSTPPTPLSLDFSASAYPRPAASPMHAGLGSPPAFDRSHMRPAFGEFSEEDAVAAMETKSPREPRQGMPLEGEEDFNDLIFALKTGSFGHLPEAVEAEEAVGGVLLRGRGGGAGMGADESFDLRRISIMDTHL